MVISCVAGALCATTAATQPKVTPAAPRVEIVVVPDGGIQPQAVVDAAGTIHLLYFKGEPAHGDLFYVRRAANAAAFSQPLRVNNQAGTAIASGSVRGGRIALGRNGYVYVAWNGAAPVERESVSQNPMWYTRISARGIVDPQRAIGTHTRHLDGGGAVAADLNGNVHVVWHAAGEEDGETHRRIYVVSSTNDGARFGEETAFSTDGGNCGCCQLDALIDARGRLQVLYRSAMGGVHRDATWLTIANGKATAPVTLQPWELPACPMTTFAMAEARDGIVAAWETQQQVYTATLNADGRVASTPSPMTGTSVRKHPSIAINAAGDRLFAWTEGTAWARGGTVAWELRNRSGERLTGGAGSGTVPVWGLVAAVARPDGSFVILH